MAAATHMLARYARPLLLVVPGLLTLGATLAMVGMPLAGWLLYGIGQLGLLVVLPAAWAAYRASMDQFSNVGLVIVYVGLLLAIPVMATAVGYHLENPAAGDALLGHQLGFLGVLASAVTWAGFVFLGIAAYNGRALPTTAAVAFVLGALLALLAEIGVLGIPIWALGVLIVSLGLVSIAPPERRSVRLEQS